MGSLHSVGFSDAQGLSGALGKLAAGDISAITDGGYGNLLVMAANKAGLSIADILSEGLTDSKTNELMEAMVQYLGDIYNETKNSRVVSQQFANVYGLSASDLKAAANLAKSTPAISKQNLNFGGMMSQLSAMANSMGSRISTGEHLENLFGNLNYNLAEGVANSPALYATYGIANMLDDLVGGIALPSVSVMGTGVDLNTTVADLMRVGAMAGGLLSNIGPLMSAASNIGNGGKLLQAFGINNNLTSVSRGTGAGLLTTTTMSTSSSGSMVGNSDGSDVQNKVMSDAQNDSDTQLAEAVDETEETKLSTVDEHILAIYTLLENVMNGTSSLQVRLDGTNLMTSP